MQNSRYLSKLIPALLLALLGACSPLSDRQSLDKGMVEQAQIRNLKNPTAATYTGGQPTQEQFQALAEAGVKHIVNLRSASEQDWDEGELVRSLGMEYHSIPVAGAKGVTAENARQLSQLLERINREPALVHCASGNRVGALIALSEAQSGGLDVEGAIAEGRRWGLTRAEPIVREILAGN